MQEFIITTPEQLKTVISETVQCEIAKHLKAQSVAETPKRQQTEFLTRKQAAGILGVSFPTLNEWSKTGVLTAYRIGSRVRYKRDELEKSLLQVKTQKTRRAA